jgi:hypothetical protein
MDMLWVHLEVSLKVHLVVVWSNPRVFRFLQVVPERSHTEEE